MSPALLTGRRVLLVGPALGDLAGDPLKGAATEMAAIERLAAARSGAYDLVLVDADAWEAPALAAAVQALALTDEPAPVLLIGQRLPTPVVRNLLRLERSDVLEAPFTPEQFTAAVAGLLAAASAAPAPIAPVGGSRCWAVTGAVG
ncbi:MAG: cpaE, partial [Phenylobacterium sp.]|nr:cpaE [Phenylobacterium sp.]